MKRHDKEEEVLSMLNADTISRVKKLLNTDDIYLRDFIESSSANNEKVDFKFQTFVSENYNDINEVHASVNIFNKHGIILIFTNKEQTNAVIVTSNGISNSMFKVEKCDIDNARSQVLVGYGYSNSKKFLPLLSIEIVEYISNTKFQYRLEMNTLMKITDSLDKNSIYYSTSPEEYSNFLKAIENYMSSHSFIKLDIAPEADDKIAPVYQTPLICNAAVYELKKGEEGLTVDVKKLFYELTEVIKDALA